MSERTRREVQADLDEELNDEEQLAIDEAVAATESQVLRMLEDAAGRGICGAYYVDVTRR